MVTIAAPDGFPLEVQVSGRTDGPTLLLLPGQANSHRWWDGLRTHFDPHLRVVTFDYRGTGGSRGPVGAWTTASFAADAAAVLAQLGIEQTHVYGTSMGGRVAQRLALDHADRVDRLVLACTSPGGRHAVERSLTVRRALLDPSRDARLAVLQRLFFTEAWPRSAEGDRLFGDPTLSPEETRAHLRVSAKHDAWDDLPRIGAPTLVLHGTDDEMVPAENAPRLAERIPHARLELVDRGRHGFFLEFADVVDPLILDFLR
ncbi:MAG: alpha/beta fold hydrolase [Jatrophihabitans sp.]|uniref:alpha/beta fold hydrolase n=1 Tax=Jatrophihabitans sp. TaxID=1932789 RepID=UPI003F81D610